MTPTNERALPSTTTAIAATRPGAVDDDASFTAIQLPVTAPRGYDVLVDVHAVSVNPVDVKTRATFAEAEAPRVLGFDAAGVVVAVGESVSNLVPGDEVFYAGSIARPGANTGLHLVDARIVAGKPRSLDFAEAAALPLTAITAWEALFERLLLSQATHGTLLVVGGAGGVGSMAIQLASALTSVTIVATASRPESREWVAQLGAHHVVHPDRLADDLDVVAPRGVDWVLSSFTAGRGATLASVLRPFGEIVVIDSMASDDVMAFKPRSQTVHWEYMFARPIHDPSSIAQHQLLERVADLVDRGQLRSTATTVLHPLDADRLREAHRMVETSSTIGKVVVRRDP